MASRYEVRDEFGDDEPAGREVDLKAPRADKKPNAKPESDFDELERGTFRNEPTSEEVTRREPDAEDDAEDYLEDDGDDRDTAADDAQDRRERDERREDRGRDADASVRKRLARERRLRLEAEEDAEHYRERFEGVDRRMNQLESKVNSGETTVVLEAEAEALRVKQAAVRIKLKQAKEAGEVDLEIDLQEELATIGGDLRVNAYKVTEAKKGVTAAAATKAAPEPNRFLTRWMRQHGAWYNGSKSNAEISIAIEKEILAGGSNIRTAEHFRKIDAKLAKLYPKEFKAVRPGVDPDRARRSPVNGGDADGQRGDPTGRRTQGDINIRVQNGKAYLTEAHEAIMRKFNMDPDNPNDVNDFVKENVNKKSRR
jgi:hypothetical protein